MKRDTSLQWAPMLVLAMLAGLTGCEADAGKENEIEIEGKLLAASKLPAAKEIAPYHEGLSVFEYAVKKHIRGRDPGDVIRVAHWAVAEGREQAPVSAVGDVRRMHLAPLESVPGLDEVFRRDDLPLDLEKEIFIDLTQSLKMERLPGPLRFDYRGDLSARMPIYWLIRDQLRLVVLGNSLAAVSVNPSLFDLPENASVPVALSLATAGSNLDLQSLLAREYVADLPHLEWVVWGVAPRIFNRGMRHDRRAEIFRASPGYANDRARPANDDARASKPPLDVEAIHRQIGGKGRKAVWGWSCHEERTLPLTLTPEVETEIRRRFERVEFDWNEEAWIQFVDTVALLTKKGARVLLFTPPYHPLSANCAAVDVEGTGHQDYQKLIGKLAALDAASPQVLFTDINQAGRHGFPHEMFYDPEHMHASGAAPLTARLVQLIEAAGPP